MMDRKGAKGSDMAVGEAPSPWKGRKSTDLASPLKGCASPQKGRVSVGRKSSGPSASTPLKCRKSTDRAQHVAFQDRGTGSGKVSLSRPSGSGMASSPTSASLTSPRVFSPTHRRSIGASEGWRTPRRSLADFSPGPNDLKTFRDTPDDSDDSLTGSSRKPRKKEAARQVVAEPMDKHQDTKTGGGLDEAPAKAVVQTVDRTLPRFPDLGRALLASPKKKPPMDRAVVRAVVDVAILNGSKLAEAKLQDAKEAAANAPEVDSGEADAAASAPQASKATDLEFGASPGGPRPRLLGSGLATPEPKRIAVTTPRALEASSAGRLFGNAKRYAASVRLAAARALTHPTEAQKTLRRLLGSSCCRSRSTPGNEAAASDAPNAIDSKASAIGSELETCEEAVELPQDNYLHFWQRPSVGTWLQETRSFPLLPKVDDHLHGAEEQVADAPACETAEAAASVEHLDVTREMPFHLRPSVGTWQIPYFDRELVIEAHARQQSLRRTLTSAEVGTVARLTLAFEHGQVPHDHGHELLVPWQLPQVEEAADGQLADAAHDSLQEARNPDLVGKKAHLARREHAIVAREKELAKREEVMARVELDITRLEELRRSRCRAYCRPWFFVKMVHLPLVFLAGLVINFDEAGGKLTIMNPFSSESKFPRVVMDSMQQLHPARLNRTALEHVLADSQHSFVTTLHDGQIAFQNMVRDGQAVMASLIQDKQVEVGADDADTVEVEEIDLPNKVATREAGSSPGDQATSAVAAFAVPNPLAWFL